MTAVLPSMHVGMDVIDLTGVNVQISSLPGTPKTPPPMSPLSNPMSPHSRPMSPVLCSPSTSKPTQPQLASSGGPSLPSLPQPQPFQRPLQLIPLLPPPQILPPPPSQSQMAAFAAAAASQPQIIIPYADLRTTPKPLPPAEKIHGKCAYVVEYNKYYKINNDYFQVTGREKNRFIVKDIGGITGMARVADVDLKAGGLLNHPQVQPGVAAPTRKLPAFLFPLKKNKSKKVKGTSQSGAGAGVGAGVSQSGPSQSASQSTTQPMPGKLPTKTKVKKRVASTVFAVPPKKPRKARVSRPAVSTHQPAPSSQQPLPSVPYLPVPSLPIAPVNHRVLSDEKGMTLGGTVTNQQYAWYFSAGPNQWIPIDSATSDAIEQSYLEKVDSVGYYIGQYHYKLVFSSMTQTNLATYMQRTVKRCSKKFDPNDVSIPKPPSVADSSRISALISMLGSSQPTYWTPEDIKQAMQSPQVIPCQPGDTEFDMVARMIQVSYTTHAVVKVSKIINPMQYFRYTHWCDTLRLKFPTMDLNERYAFHGTHEKAIDSIVREGFKYRFNSRHMYGRGSYFALNANYCMDPLFAAPNANGERFVIVTRICVGNTVQGTQDLLPSTTDSYQTAVDNVHSPSMYVTFHDDQTFPEFLVMLK